MVLGLVVGLGLHYLIGDGESSLARFLHDYITDGLLDAVGQVFIASLKLLVVPMVFVSLVCGCSGLSGENSRMGAIAGKSVFLYMCTTALAITLALSLAMLIQPGTGIDLESNADYVAKEAPSLKQTFINIFPSNPIQAMAEGNMLQVIVFAILFGMSLSKAGEHGVKIREFFEHLNEVIMKMVVIVMELAPYGVFCLLTALFAETGFDAMGNLALYFFTVVLALLLHATMVYGSLVTFVARLNPLQFFSKMRPVQLFAFSTASSNATMPVTLNMIENRMGVNNSVASFTIPLGATINMDGTAIMQGVATVFIAQVYGIDIGLSGYLTVIATATLASIGTAGVPGVGLVMLAMVLQQVGLPVEGIGLILGVDRLLDMMRTAVNVTGDCAVSCTVARGENAFDQKIFETPVKELNAQVN
jgi:Na+/H+-dicarboxylate symporter